jgi:hypothetical protein
MHRRLIVYQDNITDELKQVFSATATIVDDETVKDVIVVEDTHYYEEELINYIDLYELLSNDFDGEVTLYLEPFTKTTFPFLDDMKTFIKTLPHRMYAFEDVIPYMVLNNHPLQKKVKSYIESTVKEDVIDTVLAFIKNNMNSSLSAKRLYMHRNTLNYRIDNFVEKVHINVKDFKGANAMYMLYQYD